MTRYFLRALRTQFHGGMSLFALSLFGVALGVASVLSIQIINLNAMGAFRGSMQAVSGAADIMVMGRLPVLPERLYPQVLATKGVEAAWPLYRADVALADGENPRGYLEVLGVDFFTPVDVPWEGERVDVSEALGRPGWAAVSPVFAKEQGLEVGDTFEASIGTKKVELLVGALSDFQRVSPYASPRLVVMDIAQAQSLLGGVGELEQIDVRVQADTSVREVAAALKDELGPTAQVLTPEQRQQQAADLTSAFRLNLTALSLVSLFVGGFLVYSSTQANLVRRRTEFGLLRSLGATRKQLFGLLVGDVLILGLLGVAVGMPLGYVVASANVGRISSTVANLYLLEEIHSLQVPLWFFLLAAALGLLGAALGAVLPMWELGRKDTRALLAAFTLHEQVGAAAPKLFAIGSSMTAAIGVLYMVAGDRWRPAGFVEAFLLIGAIPLLTPLLVGLATSLLKVESFGMFFGMKGLGKQLQTTPVAIAALAIAVSMVVGVTTMVASFRDTLGVWIESTIRADIYVSTPSWRRAREDAVMDDSVIEVMRSHPRVAQVDRLRQFFAYTGDHRFSLNGVDMNVAVDGRFTLLEGNPSEAAEAVRKGAVLVGEPLARKAGLTVGDDLVVEGREQPVRLPIAGIYYDYSSDFGSAFVHLDTLEEHFGAGPINNVALYLVEGADPDQVVDELRAKLQDVPLRIRSNRRLRQEAMRIFDQTFAITRLLRHMSLLIAVCGVTLTLIVLAKEKASELALYRALGAERGQIFRVYLGKGLGMSLAGIALGTLAGVIFALILVYVVNRAFFGWTIALHWPIRVLAEQSAIIIVTSVVASIYPALIASRTPATELRREDL